MLVEKCCNCISLKMGTIIIGWLSLVISKMNMISIGVSIRMARAKYETEQRIYIGLDSTLVIPNSFYMGIFFYVMVTAICSALMISGANRKISSYLYPWLALTFGGIVFSICLSLGLAIGIITDRTIWEFLGVLLGVSAVEVLLIHLWLVVYSHYKELVAEKFGYQTRPSDGNIETSPQMNPYHNV